jgi:hypothetical protein
MMTLLQIRAEWLNVLPIALDGVAPGRATLASGAYPFSMRLCMVVPERPSVAAARFIAFVKSDAGASLMRGIGAEPAE